MEQKSLEEYFEEKGIPHVLPVFSEKGIDETSLLVRLKYSDLERLGIKSFFERKKVYEIIKEINLTQKKRNDSYIGVAMSPRLSVAQTLGYHDQVRCPKGSRSDKKGSVSDYDDVSFAEIDNTENLFEETEKEMYFRQLGEKITVSVRKKPCEEREGDSVDIYDKDVVVNELKVKLDLEKYVERHTFSFDCAFDEGCLNEDLYQKSVKNVLDHVVNGGNGSVIAYGQTGTGKTHTMFHPFTGIIYLSIKEFLEKRGRGKLSFYEIYMGCIYDLLNYREKVLMRESNGKVYLSNLVEEEFASLEEATGIINRGMALRKTGVTGANSESSRSHAILRLAYEADEEVVTPKVQPRRSVSARYCVEKCSDRRSTSENNCLVFVDLAGSERGNDRKAAGGRIKSEGAEINKSLLALKECIRGMDRDSEYLPFRQSKLTQVLKNSFIGSSKTCIIATISPSVRNIEHTLNTLRYASRIKDGRSAVTKECSVKNVFTDFNMAERKTLRSSLDFIKRRSSLSQVKPTPSSVLSRGSSTNSSLMEGSGTGNSSHISWSNSTDETKAINLLKKRIDSSIRKIKTGISGLSDERALEKVCDSLRVVEKKVCDLKF